MINVLNHFSGVHRKYVGSFNDKLRALAKKMSFQLTNTTQFMEMPIGRLNYVGADGTLSVFRHGNLEIIKGTITGGVTGDFIVKVTRGDGHLCTSAGSVSFVLRDSSGVEVGITETYNKETGYWSLEIIDAEQYDENGYWLWIYADDSIMTQYPMRYKSADQGEVADLIPFGTYEAEIPHWKVSTEYSPTPDPSNVSLVEAYVLAADPGSKTFWTARLGTSGTDGSHGTSGTSGSSGTHGTFGTGYPFWTYSVISIEKRFILESSVPFYSKNSVTRVSAVAYHEVRLSNYCCNELVDSFSTFSSGKNVEVNIKSSDGAFDENITEDIYPTPVYDGDWEEGIAKITTYTITNLTPTPVALQCNDEPPDPFPPPPVWIDYTEPVTAIDVTIVGGVSFKYE